MILTANDAVSYIHSLSKFGKKAGLSNTALILKRLGNPHKGQKFVHVAGTNGKGSVSNMIKNILISHNYKVGYYTSPYIEFFSERICIGNNMISDSDLVTYTNRVKEVCHDINPIEFEFITAMAFLYFKEKQCDITVLEVGLGGRFDATNVIDTPLLNVITPIGLDHTAILGDTLDKIAFEKAGTIKQSSTVVISPDLSPECIEVIKDKCNQTDSTMIVPKGELKNTKFLLPYTSFDYDDNHYELSLHGTYQVGNAITAIEAAKALSVKIPISDEDISNGLKNSFWKCRFEIVCSNPTVVLDGAHNSHGIKALMQSIDTYFGNKRKIFLFSMLSEKDWCESVELLSGYADIVIVTTVPSLRKTSPKEIFDLLSAKGIDCLYIEDCVEAYTYAKNLATDDAAIFAFGSLYLAGELRKHIYNVEN